MGAAVTLKGMKKTSLLRSVPAWALTVLSLAAAAAGTWLLTTKLSVMEQGLLDGTATNGDVYAGQAWAIIGGILLGTGVLGVLLVLFLAALRAVLPAAPALPVEDTEDAQEDELLGEDELSVEDDAPAPQEETYRGALDDGAPADDGSALESAREEIAPVTTER